MQVAQLKLSLQNKQRQALELLEKYPVLFYGGAKGGGKSYLARVWQLDRRLTYPATHGLIIRKTYPQLFENHVLKFFEEYPFMRSLYNKAEKIFYFPNGSTLTMSYLQTADDVYNFFGREYEDIAIDEAQDHKEIVFKILRGSNRTINPNIRPRILLTGNPGGIGHGWLKRIFVDGNFKEEEDPKDFAFLQAKVHDNPKLLEADPDYLARLKGLPEDKRRAYLDGDWDVFAGQVFTEFRRELHIIKPFLPKREFPHFLWIDWGYSGKETDEGAFACYASALIKAKHMGETFNRVITYKEWYGKFKYPDQWAEIIYQDTNGRLFREGIADSSMFKELRDGT